MKINDYCFIAAFMILISLMAGDYFYFRHQGARFTAQDGQELCERVKKLDGQPCVYNQRKR